MIMRRLVAGAVKYDRMDHFVSNFDFQNVDDVFVVVGVGIYPSSSLFPINWSVRYSSVRLSFGLVNITLERIISGSPKGL